MAAPLPPTSLLIVEDDPQLRAALTRELAARGFEVHTTDSVDAALATVAREPVDVVLTDLRRGGPDGVDLLRRLPDVSRRTRAIVMSAEASARDHQVANEPGAVAVLVKPFATAELLRAIERAVDSVTGVQGHIHGLSLIDIAQMFHLAKRSVTVRVHQPGAAASTIHFENGEIVHAEHRGHHGPAALRALLATPSGTVATAPLGLQVPRTITSPFEHLLLASLSQIDEEQQHSHRSTASYRIPELGGIADLHDPEPGPPPPLRVEDPALASSTSAPTTIIPDLIRDPIHVASQPPLAPPANSPRPATRLRPALSDACLALLTAIDAGLACAVVSLLDGALLGYHQRPALGEPLGDAVAAAAHALLRGPAVARLAVADAAPAPDPGAQEAQLTTPRHHVFVRALADGRSAVALVTRRTITVGMGWALLRAELTRVEAELS